MRGPIQGLLDEHLADLVNRDIIAWDAVPFEPARGVSWYEPRLIGGPERILSIGSSPYMEQRGVYQIKLYAPAGAATVGSGEVNGLMDQLTSHYRAGTILTDTGIRVTLLGCNVAPPLVDPRWYTLPVSVNYMAHYFA